MNFASCDGGAGVTAATRRWIGESHRKMQLRKHWPLCAGRLDTIQSGEINSGCRCAIVMKTLNYCPLKARADREDRKVGRDANRRPTNKRC